jgi:hypothetical protein
MNQSCARPVAPEEFEQGYAICNCGKYAYVFRAATLARLPKGYNGDLCKECSCLMVAVEMLMPNAKGQATDAALSRQVAP